MARRIKTKISWSKKKPLVMASLAHKVSKTIVGNATTFPNPPSEVTSLDATANNVENYYPSRKEGAIAKDKFEKENDLLNSKLYAAAQFVDNIAKGVAETMHLAGFDSTKPNLTSNSLPSSTVILKTNSLPGGTITVTVDKVDNADSYTYVLVMDSEFRVTVDDDMIVIPKDIEAFIVVSGKRTATFKNLDPQRKVSIAVIVNNSKGKSGFSTVASTSSIL